MEKSAKYSKRRTIFIIVACLATAISTQPAPGFLGIGGKKPEPEPTPAPTPAKTAEKPKTTPTPKAKTKPSPESTPQSAPTPTATPTPSPEKAKNKTKTAPKETASPTPSPAPTKKKTPAKPAEKPAAETSNKLDETGLLKPADLGGTDLVSPSDVLPPPSESSPTPETAKTETTKEPETPASDSSAAGTQKADLPADLDLIPLPIDVDGDAQLLDLPMNEGLLPSGDIPPLNAPTGTLSVPTAESERVLSSRYKALLTKTEKDPRLVALWATAEKAKTYEQSRAAKREYYRQLFAVMRKADKTLTKRIDAMERAYLERLSQTRIEPTIPLGPPPKIEPLQ